MIKLLLLSLLTLSSLLANKVIYLSYDEVPKRVVKGEIFPITLKALSTIKDFDDIEYVFSNFYGLEILTQTPDRIQRGKYLYDTFYMISSSTSGKLPDVQARLITSQEYNSTKILGNELNIITLNPKKNYSNIIANNFQLIDYKTTSYDNKHNIIVFIASAQNCDIKAMKFQDAYRQGIESVTDSYSESKITYYLVVDKKIENFSFSYFNLLQNKFILLNVPIIVNDDSVSTQSDIKPKNQSREKLKMSIAAGIALTLLVFIILRKKYVYFVLMLLPLAYMGSLSIPQKDVCVKKGTRIHLLPLENGTIFDTTSVEQNLPKEGSVQNFVKVQLKNEKIGWVRHEDICSY